jgi:hypothetical protein
MRVFVLQINGKYDVSAAKSYGQIVYLVSSRLNPFDLDKFVGTVEYELYSTYKFDAKKDAICLTGSSILVALFLAVLAHHHKKINVLLFDAKTSKYRLRILTLECRQGEKE